MSENNTKNKYMGLSRRKWTSLALVAIFILGIIFFDLSTVGGNNLRLYVKSASCGGWPVETVGRVAGEVPSYQPAQGFVLFLRGGAEYYCTPLDAESAGYSASSYQYQFPNLEADKKTTNSSE